MFNTFEGTDIDSPANKYKAPTYEDWLIEAKGAPIRKFVQFVILTICSNHIVRICNQHCNATVTHCQKTY